MTGFKKAAKQILFYLAIFIICCIVIFPFILLFSYSLRTDSEIFSIGIRLIPYNPTLKAYKSALFDYEVGGTKFSAWAGNSILVCGLATVISIFISSMCGYGISRYRFYGRRPLWFIILLTQTVPWVVVLIPYFVFMGKLGILNRLSAVSLSYLAIFTPVSTWLFTGFFENIPKDLEDAARIDGCGHFRVYYQIILPLSIPGISAIALFAFVIGWSDYLIASILISSVEKWTLPIGLSSFQGEHRILWAQIMAMSTLITIPIIVLFLYLQRYLINLLAGGVKQ